MAGIAMSELIALTRSVSPAMADCELTHLPPVPIDVDRAVKQHAAYEQALEMLGCTVRGWPRAADMPDSVFIEDTAVVLDDIAVIDAARCGVAPRRRPPASRNVEAPHSAGAHRGAR